MVFLYFLSLVVCFIFRKSNKPILQWNCVILMMILLASSMRVGYDTENFIRFFQEMTVDKDYYNEYYILALGWGYTTLTWLFNLIGISNFFLFKFLVLLLVSICVSSIIFKYCRFPLYLLLMYLIGPFFDDAMQLRNTISLCFLLLSFKYCVEKQNYKFFICLSLACINHILFLSFLLLFVIVRYCTKKIIDGLCIGGFVFYIILYFTHNFSIYGTIRTIARLDKFSEEVETATNFGSLIVLIFYVASLAIVFYSNRIIENSKGDQYYSFNYKRVSHIILSIFKVSSVFLFLCVITLSSMRFFRDLIILLLINVFLCYPMLNNKQKYKLISGVSFLMLYFFYMSDIYMGPPEDIVYSVLQGDPSWVINVIN